MQVHISRKNEKGNTPDAVVLPFWSEKKKPISSSSFSRAMQAQLQPALLSGDFSGKLGEVVFLYPSDKAAKRIVLLGLGEQKKCTPEQLRRAYASLTAACHSKKAAKIHLALPEMDTLKEEEVAKYSLEGMLLANYAFEKHKGEKAKAEKKVLLSDVTLLGVNASLEKEMHCLQALSEAVYFARDLVNTNADEITPERLGQEAMALAKRFPALQATVLDRAKLNREKLGLLLAVNRGSCHEPRLIVLEYKGNPGVKERTLLVGKGLTFDSGGLNLKPTGHIETMKCDMSGAAAVLGTLLAAAKLKLKTNLVGVIPATENSIGSRSYKPGDVYTSYAGKTVEIANTDAEGRLILADALAYGIDKFKPTRVIDLATLTGAIVVALGEEATGLMSNDDALANAIYNAGERTFERVWRMPIYEELKDQLKSDIADLKNSGGREGSSITAAMFLQEFVRETPWAHLDIAGTAFLSKDRRYNPKGGTGVGIRLLIDLLMHEGKDNSSSKVRVGSNEKSKK